MRGPRTQTQSIGQGQKNFSADRSFPAGWDFFRLKFSTIGRDKKRAAHDYGN